jgi:putative toxin-antitoxin system antitoxin component (TIGR02293 family)
MMAKRQSSKAGKALRAARRSRALGGRSTVRPLLVTRGKGTGVFKAFVTRETSTAGKIDAIRGGIAARVVDDMVQYLDVPKHVIFGLLHTPESTAHRLIKDNRTLDAAASERVVRVADITRMAQETFGGRPGAAQWLKTGNLALGGATPLSMLDTEPGASEVRRILAAIDHGGVV